MASGPLSGGHGKVYSRKSHTPKASKPPPSSADPGPHPAPSADAPSNGLLLLHRPTVTIPLSSSAPSSRRDLRRRLSAELDQVRALSKRLESASSAATGHALSQLSATDPSTPVSTKRTPLAQPFRNNHLAIDVATPASGEAAAEKRTPKANQYYRDADFLLSGGKDKLPPQPPAAAEHKKSKSKKGNASDAAAREKLYAPAFKSCAALLSKLMKHKHGWVFNKPVDADALGLHDYHTIIAQPMDLGTVKSRLGSGHYRSPREFAADVRLTFRNAMTYNPKGQDVHAMAEQLLRMFEEKWPDIEAEVAHLSPQLPTPSSAAPKKPPMIDTRALERSDSTVHAAGLEATPKPHIGRPPVLKKPKAKEPNKREMTFWEKQRLSNNLQSLPPEKLNNVVQIIKRRNLSLSQHDDEIEVDIDSFDVETLWELDRFVTNYKKSLSKNKRKAELAVVARQDETEQDLPPPVQKTIPEAVDVEPPKESAADENERYVGSSSPVQEDHKGENASRSSSSGSSSSDSGSSSSDTDTDSSSADGSDAGQSPRT